MTLIRTFPVVVALVAAGCQKPEKEAPKGGSAFQQAGELSSAEKGAVVAKVGDVVITLEDFERRLNQQSPFARARYNSLERKREFLDGLVRFELLAREAEAKGFGDDPDVVLARKQAMVKRLSGDELTKLVKPEDVTDAEVAAHYEQNLIEYDKPAEVRASQLVVKDEATAKKLQADLVAAVSKDPHKAREAFADMARQRSEDAATREAGGDLGFFSKPGEPRGSPRAAGSAPLPPAVAEAAWALDKVGDLAPAPIQTEAGWHLVQKTGFKRPYKRELEEVKTNIRNRLFREKKAQAMEAYVQKLRDAAKVEIDEAVLEKAEATKGTGPGVAPPILGPGGGLPMPRPDLPGLPGLPGVAPTDEPEGDPQ